MTPDDARRLVRRFLDGRPENTRRAYGQDLGTFRAFLGEDSVEAAAERLVDAGAGEGNGILLDFQAWMRGTKAAPATRNRRLACVRMLVRTARVLGLCAWEPLRLVERCEAYRDTAGPGVEAVADMLALAAEDDTPKGRRNVAMLRLLWDLALRASEVVGLDLEHVELRSRRVWVLGKGRGSREWRTLPEATTEALRAWIADRGSWGGPLFIGCARAGTVRRRGLRLDRADLYRLVRALGRRVGVRVRPHGIRHAAITHALDVTGGDVRRVQRFSRHVSVQTVLVYDDARTDTAGEVAALLAAAVPPKP